MILRVVTGRVPPGRLSAVREAYELGYRPVAEQATGLARWLVATHGDDAAGHDLAALTLWATVESALSAYGGSLDAVRTLDGSDHGERLTEVDYYEVDADAARRRSGRPSHLRLTAGRVARGLDADIQQDLRRRLPALPSEALEAYVGRRVLEDEVEIAFVSTWVSVPDGMRLDVPLWPDISARYDSFRLEVLDVLLDGDGPAHG